MWKQGRNYTPPRAVHCVLPKAPLRGIDDFDDKPSLIIQWKLRSPCVGAADYPFANLLVER